MTWVISKDFSFCYGHRVWSQSLNAEFCENGDDSCKCKNYHGHEGTVTIELKTDSLSLKNGMVTDFKHLGWLKNFLDDNLDHKFIIDENDPLFETLVNFDIKDEVQKNIFIDTVGFDDAVFGMRFNESVFDIFSSHQQDHFKSFFIVDFVPTSENLAQWLYRVVYHKMKDFGVTVSKVTWCETPKSKAVFTPNIYRK